MRLASLPRIGLITAAVYVANAALYGWQPVSRDWRDDLAAWGIALVLALLYWAGYRVLIHAGASVPIRRIVIPAVVLAAISFVTIPYDSTDVFQYMAVGWAQAHYGMNPYTQVLRDIPDALTDPMINTPWMRSNKNSWLDLPLVYGFTFASLIKGIAVLGSGNWWLTLGLFKLLNVAAYAGAAVLVLALARSLGLQRPDIAMYLFLWSPLILLHHIANGHNDLLMGSLILLAIYLSTTRAAILGLSAIVAATLLKYATLFLIPILAIFVLRRKGWRRALASAALATAVAVLLSLPYIESLAGFRVDLIAAQLSKITAGSLYAFIFYLYRAIAPGSLAAFGAAVKVVLWILGAALILRETWKFLRKERLAAADLIESCSWIMFVVIFVASSQFYSWYIGMFLPLALLLNARHWLRQFAILLGATHVFSLTSLSRKGIGYFMLTTGLATGILLKNRRVKN